MTGEEISYLQLLLKKILDKEFSAQQLNTMFEHQNKYVVEQVARLAFTSDRKITNNIIALLYKYGAFEQLSFILAQGNYPIGMIMFKELMKFPEGLEIISAITLPALVKCSYLFNIHDVDGKSRIKNIWQLLRDFKLPEIVKLAGKIANEIKTIEGLNSIIRNTLIAGYNNVFNIEY